MAQQFDYPKSETDLRVILDALYKSARTAREAGNRPAFKGLVELMSAQATIITAIHNIKSNKGSKTPGIDHKTMQKGYLQKPTAWVISRPLSGIMNHKKYAGSILINRERQKSVRWESLRYEIESFRNASGLCWSPFWKHNSLNTPMDSDRCAIPIRRLPA